MNLLSSKISTSLSIAILILGWTIGYSIWSSGGENEQQLALVENTVSATDERPSFLTETNINPVQENFVPSKLTDLVGQNIFSNIVQAKGAGAVIDDSSVDVISDQIFDNLYDNNKIIPKNFSANNLRIIGAPTATDWQTFSAAVSLTRAQYDKEFAAILDSSQGNVFSGAEDPKLTNALVQSGLIYQKMATDLSKISVPGPAISVFLKLLNAYSQSAAGLGEFKYFQTDPIRALPGLKTYQDARQVAEVAVQELQSLFLANGIIQAIQVPSGQ